MATDGPTPPPCDPEIFSNGRTVCVVTGSSNQIERWVKSIAKTADAMVDWHYAGGRGNVLHLGDDASCERVLAAIPGIIPPSARSRPDARTPLEREANELDLDLFHAGERMRRILALVPTQRRRAKLITGIIEIGTARFRIREYLHPDDRPITS